MVEDACEQWQKEHTEKFKPVLTEFRLLSSTILPIKLIHYNDPKEG